MFLVAATCVVMAACTARHQADEAAVKHTSTPRTQVEAGAEDRQSEKAIGRLSSRSPQDVEVGETGTLFSQALRAERAPNGRPAAALYAMAPPADFHTEQYDVLDEEGFVEVATRPLSTFSIDVDTASYSNVRRFLNDGTLPPSGAVRVEEMINYFSYAYPQPDGEHPFSVSTELSVAPWNDDHRLVLIGLQGRELEPSRVPARNLVFLIDVSGSMQPANKLPLLRKALTELVRQMRTEDHVAIVVYAGASGCVLEPTSG
ncbi:MAG: VWA domain-containing protein, partial [Myxococcales bacterium]